MKRIVSLLVLLSLLSVAVLAQNVPQGMKYQAVARDSKGIVLANSAITLKINLYSERGGKAVSHYSEVHHVVTNELGLFTLVVGDGKSDNNGLLKKSNFADIPWSTEDIWMEIAIQENGKPGFTTISNSKLLSVPYAFHAGTASKLLSNMIQLKPGPSTDNPSPTSGNSWNTSGNLATNPATDYLGTADAADLIIKTNGVTRMVIGADGSTSYSGIQKFDNDAESTSPTTGALIVAGGVGIGKRLNVKGSIDVEGYFAVNVDKFKVVPSGNTDIKGTLDVAGNFAISNTFKVAASTGNITIAGGVGIGSTAQSNTKDDGALVVEGGVGIENNLNVGGNLNVSGSSSFQALSGKSLNISDNSQGFIATFTNTNDESGANAGDGIKIKLGKSKTNLTIPPINSEITSEIQQELKDLLNCNTSNPDKLLKLLDLAGGDLLETGKVVAGLAVGAGNMLIDFLNDKLGLDPNGRVLLEKYDLLLPILKWINGDTCPGSGFGDFVVKDDWVCWHGDNDSEAPEAADIIFIPEIKFPKIPEINLEAIGIDAIDPLNLDFWGVPSICFTDDGTPLDNDNEFIQFADKDNTKVGSIRGVSVTNWTTHFLDPIFLFKLKGAIGSSKVDKFHAQYHFKSEIKSALVSYRSIGVEYSSGNGDYAEWLERKDKKELITPGDIVGVIGGRITKDLHNAEQVMVVSHNPIVLGNIPEEGKNFLGNNIAFVGQVHVKVVGPVKTGDYIIGRMETPGYGIAKHPDDMTPEDFKYAVGRSWDENLSDEPKMVNTVVGLQNGDYFKILMKYENKFKETDSRLRSLEEKIDDMSNKKLFVGEKANNKGQGTR